MATSLSGVLSGLELALGHQGSNGMQGSIKVCSKNVYQCLMCAKGPRCYVCTCDMLFGSHITAKQSNFLEGWSLSAIMVLLS